MCLKVKTALLFTPWFEGLGVTSKVGSQDRATWYTTLYGKIKQPDSPFLLFSSPHWEAAMPPATALADFVTQGTRNHWNNAWANKEQGGLCQPAVQSMSGAEAGSLLSVRGSAYRESLKVGWRLHLPPCTGISKGVWRGVVLEVSVPERERSSVNQNNDFSAEAWGAKLSLAQRARAAIALAAEQWVGLVGSQGWGGEEVRRLRWFFGGDRGHREPRSWACGFRRSTRNTAWVSASGLRALLPTWGLLLPSAGLRAVRRGREQGKLQSTHILHASCSFLFPSSFIFL